MSVTQRFYAEGWEADRVLTLEADGAWRTHTLAGEPAAGGACYDTFDDCYPGAITRQAWEERLEEARQLQAAGFDAVGVPSEPAFAVGQYVRIPDGRAGQIMEISDDPTRHPYIYRVRPPDQLMGDWYATADLAGTLLDKTNDLKFFYEEFVKVAAPRPVAPELALTPIAPAEVRRGDILFNEKTKMLSKVVEVLNGHLEVIDEDEYESYWLAADQRLVSWAYRLEVK